MERHLIDYIRRPELLDKQATAHLQDLTERYPYFHVARVLLLKALYQQHDTSFDHELKEAAILLPDRSTIFQLVEQRHYESEEPRKHSSASSAEKDATSTLLDDFLDTLPQESKPNRRHPVDASVDYIGYLLQQGEIDAPDKEDAQMKLIDDFLDNGEGRIQLSNSPQEQLNITEEDTQKESENEIITEIMAQIYIKQGKFQQAIEIIKRISANYPKKNRYFADQIRFLEKILANEKNKKQQ